MMIILGTSTCDSDDIFSILTIYSDKMMIKSGRRKADISAHMQTDMIEVDFGFITNAGILIITYINRIQV